jgi:hypothetical protein
VAAPVPSVAAPAPVLAAPVLHAPTAVPVLSAAPLLYDSVEVEEEAMSATYPLSSPLPTLSPLSPSPLSAASLSALCGLSLRSLRPLSPLSAASLSALCGLSATSCRLSGVGQLRREG